MRRLILFIHLLLGILLGGCNSQPIPSSDVSPSIGEIISRDAIVGTSIANGSQALFHATGGASIDNQIFTYNNGVWQNAEGESIPINTASETTLTALYPAYSGETLITNNPYANDTLQDVLIAQSTFTNQTDVQLKFRHLFSRLTVHVHSSIAESIDAIKIEAPKVYQIDPINGTFTFSGTHTTLLIGNDTGIYSCIVPAHQDCPLKLTFVFSADNEVTHSLTHTFVGGNKYECHVNRPGIRNAADLIEFSQFINDPNNKGKYHSDFGEQIGDSIVYRLLADITLKPEDCQELVPIGEKEATPFYDTFDGQGHSISDLLIPSYNNYAGLFGHIESTGNITNLHIRNASSTLESCGKFMGIIASYNNGTINNCSASNSTIYSKEGGYMGGICSQSEGVIINCYSQSNTFYVTERVYSGGIASSAEKRIHNCYSSNNTFETSGSGYKIGGIVGASTVDITLNIRNCYVYHNQETPEWGSAIGNAVKTSIKGFYYNKGNLYAIKSGSVTDSDTYKYDKNFQIDSVHIIDLLNDWIDTTGKESYKDYTYNHWTTDDNGFPCFK